MLIRMKLAYSLTASEDFSKNSGIVKGYLVAILLLIIFFYFILWFIKAYRRGGFLKGGNRLKVIDRLMLSKDSSICIVQVNEKYLLLSVSATAVHLIKELDKEDFDSIQLENNEEKNADFKQNFIQCLKDKLMNGGKK